MSKSNETPSTPAGDDRNLVASAQAASAPELEEVVQQFWEKNRNLLIGLAAVILLAIVARNGWAIMQASQLESAREDYAAASSDAELKAFAADRAGTQLAGVALLKVADNAFAEGRYAEAISGYDTAAEQLEGSVFADRIALGRAMAQLLSGDSAGGASALRTLANDTDTSAAVRGEAIFHLAALAMEAGDAAQLDELSVQIDAISPGSSFAQRVTMMRSSLATPGSEDEDSDGISFSTP
ncbi:MAG: hypothetical protein SynsKO_11360 [Synoicihabitans sp.]